MTMHKPVYGTCMVRPHGAREYRLKTNRHNRSDRVGTLPSRYSSDCLFVEGHRSVSKPPCLLCRSNTRRWTKCEAHATRTFNIEPRDFRTSQYWNNNSSSRTTTTTKTSSRTTTTTKERVCQWMLQIHYTEI